MFLPGLILNWETIPILAVLFSSISFQDMQNNYKEIEFAGEKHHVSERLLVWESETLLYSYFSF